MSGKDTKGARLRTLARRWLRVPEFKAAYDALGPEFEIIATLVRARANAGLSQSEVAARMGTSQASIARLESGRLATTTRTIRRYAAATGHRVRIVLEPVGKKSTESPRPPSRGAAK